MPRTVQLRASGREFTADVQNDGRITVGDRTVRAAVESDGTVRFPDLPDAVGWAVSTRETRWVFLDGRVYQFEVVTAGSRRRARGHHGSLMAPMPATVRRIDVAAGEKVERGQTLIILEAMKMELPVKAASAGTVKAINCREGDLVQPGTALIELDEEAQ